MTMCARILIAASVLGSLAAPAAAQTDYPPQGYPQGYPPPGYDPQTYTPQTYSDPGNVIGSVIDSLLGNRYNVTDRTAVKTCASASVQEAWRQYGRYWNGYGNQNGYGNGYDRRHDYQYGNMRVTAITDVQRKSSGVRVKGLISSGMLFGQQGQNYGQNYGRGYINPGYPGQADLSFSCKMDYRGYVVDVNIDRYRYRGY
jgi:hypothetical protein